MSKQEKSNEVLFTGMIFIEILRYSRANRLKKLLRLR